MSPDERVLIAIAGHPSNGGVEPHNRQSHLYACGELARVHGLSTVLRVIRYATDWPFDSPFDVYDLRRHWHRAAARAAVAEREARRRRHLYPDAHALLKWEREWERKHGR